MKTHEPGADTDLNTQLINSLQSGMVNLAFDDDVSLDALRRRAKLIIGKIFGADSKYLEDLSDLRFHCGVYVPGMPECFEVDAWKRGKQAFLNLCATMVEDLELEATFSNEPGSARLGLAFSDKVFIVHGHDEMMKLATARTLEKLCLEAIILHEQADKGRTVIEKFVGHSDVGFAVVLLSPDDMAHMRAARPETARPRARQNVVLELGYFLGKLGRDRVVALYREEPNFEMPSDYAGVLFKPFDAAGHWRFELVKELRACGYQVDANNLCSDQ